TRSASLGRRPFRVCGWGEESIVLPSSRAERSAVEGPYFLRFAAIWLKQGPSTWPFGPWSGRRKASVSFLHHQLRHKKGVTAPHPFWLQGVTVLNAFKILLAFCTASLIVGTGTVAGLFWHFGHGLPDHKQLADYQPATVSRLYAADGRLLAEYAKE